MLLMPNENNSHVIDVGTKQNSCYRRWNKTKLMLLMPEQNKTKAIDAVFLTLPTSFGGRLGQGVIVVKK